MKFMNILHIEDEPLIQRTVKRLFWESNVTTASTYEEALESLGIDGEYDLILSDHDLKEGSGDGGDILKWIRDKRPHLEKVFIFTSANEDKISRYGVKYLVKPYTRNQLFEALEAIETE